MESTRIDELAAQVVAWHNRNRLAQRITTDHVRAVGVVVLPFALPPGAPDAGLAQRLDPPLLDDSVHEPVDPQPETASDEPAAVEPHTTPAAAKPTAALIARLRALGDGLLKRLPRRRPATGLTAAFSDDFIAPLSPRRVARFALKQGSGERPGTPSWPQRVVPVDEDRKSDDLSVLYLRTACIELGEHRCRVLIGRGAKPRIIGPRAWSVPRVASAAAGATLLAGVATLGLLGGWIPLGDAPGSGEPTVLASLESAASAPKPAASVDEREPDHAPASTEASPSAAHAASSPSAASAPGPADSAEVAGVATTAASAPLPEPESESTPTRTMVWREAAQVSNEPPRRRPELRPELSAEVRDAALREGERLRALPLPSGKAVKAAAPNHVYAVMTAVTTSRAASEQRHQVMGSSAATGELPGKPRSELMKVGEGWRAVLWPFNSRDEADIARAMLAERGVRTEVLEF